MELLAYIQQGIKQDTQQETINGVIADQQILNNAVPVNQSSNTDLSFKTWLHELTGKSAKLSLSVILAGTTALIGLGSALSSLAAPSSDVSYVQSLLANNGFNPGEIDGVAGEATKDAIIRAQTTFGLKVDGVAGEQTIAALSNGGTNAPASPESTESTKSTESPIVANTDNVTASSTVMNLQKLLSDRGFYNGAVDGIMGTQTRNAIIAAQKAYSLTPDGVAGPRTIAALETDNSKANPSAIVTKDENVASLQELLSKRGFYNGAVDGIMGPQTRLAIVSAQKNYGLVTDGIAGRQTIAALEANNAPKATPEPAAEPTKSASTVTPKFSQDTKDLQQLLANRGFYKGAIDGIKGDQTSEAIIAAQKAYGLANDGIAGTQTITALQRDQRGNTAVVTPAAPSNTGDRDIANLQNLLTDRGFYNGAITGVLGPRTRDAIIAAQKAYGLTSDGIAGSRTIAALEAGTAPKPVQLPAPSNTPAPVNAPAIRVETKPQTPVTQPIATPKATTPAAAATPQPAPAATPQPAPAAPRPAATTASNPQVTEIQNLLAKRGFYNGKVDGVLSGETRNAIVRAQNYYTIAPADGAPSNKLMDSLSKDTFISSESN